MTDSMEAQVRKVILQVDKFRQIDGVQEHALKDILAEADGSRINLETEMFDEDKEHVFLAKPRIKKEERKELIECLYDTRRVLCFETKIRKQPIVKNKPKLLKKVEDTDSIQSTASNLEQTVQTPMKEIPSVSQQQTPHLPETQQPPQKPIQNASSSFFNKVVF